MFHFWVNCPFKYLVWTIYDEMQGFGIPLLIIGLIIYFHNYLVFWFLSHQLAQCRSEGAIPAANITWFKNKTPLMTDGAGRVKYGGNIYQDVLTLISF